MNSSVNPEQRYVPGGTGIVDRFRTTPGNTMYTRDYTAAEILDTCAWLNDRAAGYAPKLGAHKTT